MSDAFTSDTYNALCQEAESYLNRGLPEQARELLLKAVSLIGTRPRARSILADTCMSLGLWSEAREQLEVLTTLEIGSPSHHFRLGQVLEELGELELARDNYLVVQERDRDHRQAAVAVSRLNAKLDSQPQGIDLSQVFGGPVGTAVKGGPAPAVEQPSPSREEAPPASAPSPAPESPRPQAGVPLHGDRQVFPDAPGATDVFATTDDLDSLLEDIGVKIGGQGEGDDKVQALLSSVGISLEPPKKPEAEKAPEEKPPVRDISDLLGTGRETPVQPAGTAADGFEILGGLESVFESPAGGEKPQTATPAEAAPRVQPLSLDSIFGTEPHMGGPAPGPEALHGPAESSPAPVPSLSEIFGGPDAAPEPPARPAPGLPGAPPIPPVEQMVPPPVEELVPSVEDAVRQAPEGLVDEAAAVLESAFAGPASASPPLQEAAEAPSAIPEQALVTAREPGTEVPAAETRIAEAPIGPVAPPPAGPEAAADRKEAVEEAAAPVVVAEQTSASREQPVQAVASSPASYRIAKLESGVLVGVDLKKGTLAVNPLALVAYDGQITISEIGGWLLAGGSGTVWLGSRAGTAIVHKLEEGRLARAEALAAFDAHIELVPAETSLTQGLVRVSRGSCDALVFPAGSYREVKIDGGPFTVKSDSLLLSDESVILSAAEGLPGYLVLTGRGRAVVAR